MSQIERIERRLSAVERTLTGETDVDTEALQDVLALSADVATLENRIDELETRIAELEADIESVGGYISEVDSVNEDIERHALSAVAGLEKVEDRLDELETTVDQIDRDPAEMAVEQAMASTREDGDSGGASAGMNNESDDQSAFEWVLPSLSRSDGSSPPKKPRESNQGRGDSAVETAVSETDGSTGPPEENAAGDDNTVDHKNLEELFNRAEKQQTESEPGPLEKIREKLS